jgi:AraC family transcriptional regulator
MHVILNHQTLYADAHCNALRVSEVTRYQGKAVFNGIGIKYVEQGAEQYFVKNKKYEVNAGSYLLGNTQTQSEVLINEPSAAKGICIDLSKHLIEEVCRPYGWHETSFYNYLLEEQLLVQTYRVHQTKLGQLLSSLSKEVFTSKGYIHSPDSSLFYAIAEALVWDQKTPYGMYQKLACKHVDTKLELGKKLMDAKLLLEQNLQVPCLTDQICREIGLSKYHFIRQFKQAFGMSPYQYHLHLRLSAAYQALSRGKKVIDVADAFGYADLPSFSKAFKQQYGISPSLID